MGKLELKRKHKGIINMINKPGIKIKTGIFGFDDLTLGGIPKNRCTLVRGDTGTGKTVFSVEFIYRGITDFNENGIYISFEESPEQIKKNAMSFGWDFEKLEGEGKLKIIDARDIWITSIEDESTEFGLGHLLKRIKNESEKINAKRVVIDTMFGMFIESRFSIAIRRELHKILNNLNDIGCTSILTTGYMDNTGVDGVNRTKILEAYVDCVIVLKEKRESVIYGREVCVLKMRGCNYIAGTHPMSITTKGVAVFPLMTNLNIEGAKTKNIKRDECFYTDPPRFMRRLTKNIPCGYNILLVGGVGTNAGNFARQILHDGLIRDETCLLVNTHESSHFVKKFMKDYGIDIEKFIKNDKMFFFDDYIKLQNDEKTLNDSFNNPLILGYLMDRWLMDKKPEKFRWAVNSITTLIAMNEKDSVNMQQFLYDKVRKIREFEGLGVYTINMDAHPEDLINMVENMMDMVIELKLIEEKGVQHSYMRVCKARGVIADTSWHQYYMVKGNGIIGTSDDISSVLRELHITK